MSAHDDDLLVFEDEEGEGGASPSPVGKQPEAWAILIVDDEEQVHEATRFALRGVELLGRPLHFDSVYSAAEARESLSQCRYACVLLDVVMESEDAGLKLVTFIRDELQDSAVRIILRTGQPGYAPEVDVIKKYDINDYKSKAELTRTRLITTLTASLRCYLQIKTIEANRLGLEIIIEAASNLMAVKAINKFAQGVLIQICSLLQVEPDGILCAHYPGDDRSHLRILAGSGRFADFHGKPVNELCGKTLTEKFLEVMAQRHSYFDSDCAILYIYSPRGEELAVHVTTHHPLSDLDKKLLEVFSINIAVGFDNAHLFEELEVLAFTDSLTGLPNRAAFEKEINDAIRLKQPLTVLISDIDNFQAVNDGLGHEIGNKTLRASAKLLASHFGEDTFIARTASDSFALLLPNIPQAELEEKLRGLARRCERNLEIDGNEIPLTMSVGVAHYPLNASTGSQLFQNAGIALKQAKRVSRSSFQFFDNQLEKDLQNRLETIRELRYSVERNCLRLMFQPQVSLKSHKVFGVEALVRWQRDPDNLVPPNLFIPAAEDSGHIVAMGEWILRESCKQQLRWQAEGQNLKMAVNVSMRQLKDPDFVQMVSQVLRDTSIDPSSLELEVTESMMMEDIPGLIDMLRAVREKGIRVAIDDFGTGYSSLSSLQKLPIDRLKIDRSFITGLTNHEEDQVIAALVINMGHLLNLRVIAEGVESTEQESRLLNMGCDDVQGFLYGRPMEAAAILNLARQYN